MLARAREFNALPDHLCTYTLSTGEEVDEVDLLRVALALHFCCCLQIHSDGGFCYSVQGSTPYYEDLCSTWS